MFQAEVSYIPSSSAEDSFSSHPRFVMPPQPTFNVSINIDSHGIPSATYSQQEYYPQQQHYQPAFPSQSCYPQQQQHFPHFGMQAVPFPALPPATSQPRFPQSRVMIQSHLPPSQTFDEEQFLSSPLSSQRMTMKVSDERRARRLSTKSPLLGYAELEDKGLCVSPLSIEPRKKHLARQKLKYLSNVPESMTIQSSCNLHAYKIEGPTTLEVEATPPVESPQSPDFVISSFYDERSSSPESFYYSSDDSLSSFVNEEEEHEHDPVICGSPLSDYLSDTTSQDFSDEDQSQSLLKRLKDLEQLV